ncbi:PAS domain S-box protein [Kamptonema formosum]|uniref:PAS domain S-box protein n=1 Tax=Kamptonema formosum TaxID=331992 RepID=UPI0026F3D8CA|nr:PAS domain S-box protein [Oscillatoria sp. PCC 10802]
MASDVQGGVPAMRRWPRIKMGPFMNPVNDRDAASITGLLDKNRIMRYKKLSAERMLKCKPKNKTGKRALELVHPEEGARIVSALNDFMENSGGTAPAECRFRHHDGSWRSLGPTGSNLVAEPCFAQSAARSSEPAAGKPWQETRLSCQRKFRAVFNSTFQLTWLLAPDGAVLEANQTALEFAGLEAGDVTGRLFWETGWWSVSPETEQELREAISRAKAGEAVRYAVGVFGKGDEALTLDFSLKPVLDPIGSVALLVAEGRDITELKRAHKERQRFFKNSLDLIAVADFRGYLTSVNPAWEKTLGYRQEELEGKHYTEFLHPDDWEATNAAFEREIESKQPAIACETRWRCKDGSYRWLSWNRAPFPEEGLSYGFARDITQRVKAEKTLQKLNQELEVRVEERTNTLRALNRHLLSEIVGRKRAERALGESEERFRNLVETSSDWVWETDENAACTYASPKARDILGCEPEEVLGKTPFDFMPVLEAQRAAGIFTPIGRAQQPFSCLESTSTHADGHLVVLETSGTPIFDLEGKFLGYRGMTRDITERKRAEAALRESEERYRLMAETATDMISRHTPEGVYLYASPASRTLLGYDPEELVGRSAYAFFHPEDLAPIEKSHATILEVLDISTVSYRIRRKDGRYIWFETTSRSLRDPDSGKVVELMAVSRDITERKRVEEALRESEEKFRRVFQDAPIGMTLNDLSGKGLQVNPVFCEILGYTESELKELTFYEYTPPEDIDRETPYIEGCFRGEFSRYQIEKRYLKKSGETVWVNLTAGIIRDRYGNPRYGLGMVEDITERVEVEERLRLRDRAMAASSNGIIISDARQPDLPLIYVNSAFERITGYSAAEVIGQNSRFLQGDERNQPDLDKLRAAIREGRDCTVVLRNYRKDGSLFWNELSVSPIYDASGNLTHFIGIITDITERKRAEEALQQAKAQLQAVLDAVPGLVSWIGSDLRYIGVNRHLGATFNLPPEAFVGQDIGFLERRPYFVELMRQFFAGADSQISREVTVEVGGESRSYLIVAQKYDGGRAAASVGIDITDRKRMEEELRATTSRLTALIQNLQAGVLVENECRHIAVVNQEFCGIFGIPAPPEALVGMDCAGAAEGSKTLFAEPEQFVRRISEILQDQQIVTKEELVLADGRTFERDYVPIFVENNYSGHLWMYRDISQRKQAEAALQLAKDQLQAVLDAVPGFVSWIGADLRYLGVNRHLANASELTPEEFAGQQLGFRKNSPQFTEFMRQFMASPEESASQVIDIQISGSTRNYLMVIQKYQQGTAAVSVGIDITERKQTEVQLRSSLKEKEVLLKEIHHRVKNNLQVISSLLKLQSGYIKDSEALALFTDSYNRVRSMALIHEKLYQSQNLAQIDAADYIPNLVSNLFRSYSVSSQDINLKIEVESIWLDVDTAIPCGLMMNELVSNALKYAFPCGGAGEILVKFFRTGEGQCCMIVRDDGAGMPADFDLEEAESLGLQLVWNLTGQLGGEIEVSSPADGGTFFKITFPAKIN